MEHNINITNLRKDLYKVCDAVIDTGMVVNVSCKKGNVIILSKEDYNSLLETIYLSSNPDYAKTLLEGKNVRSEELVDEEDVNW